MAVSALEIVLLSGKLSDVVDKIIVEVIGAKDGLILDSILDNSVFVVTGIVAVVSIGVTVSFTFDVCVVSTV
uniref:Uncharacterized protein n=1 Tax=Panagrolaimus sp. ES5 TaxID=591445 RepID=A0AC34F217_9BILA